MVASVEGLILGVSYFTILWCHPSPMLILLLCGFLQKSSLCSSLLPNFEPNALFRAHFTLHLSIQSIFFSPGSECILSIPTLVQGLFILPHLVVQLLSNARLFETPWTATSQVSLSFTISQSMLKLMSIKVAMPSSHLIFCCLLLPLPSIFLNIRVFFPVSWVFASGHQSIGTSASVSVLPMNIQSLFPLGLTGLISLQSKELLRGFSRTTVWKHQFFSASLHYGPTHICTWLLEKP